MQRGLAALGISLWLTGCQGWLPEAPPPAPRLANVVPEAQLTRLEGGWSLGDTLVLYEAYYQGQQLVRIAERFDQADDGSRRADYYFSDGRLVKVLSDGWERDADDGQLHHRQLWLSFNGSHFNQGQLRLDGRPERFSSDIIALVQQDAQLLQEQLQQLQEEDERLWQGRWDGQHFTPCPQDNLEGSYELLGNSDDWDWLSSFSERLRQQGEPFPALTFIGSQQPQQGKIEMTRLMSLQPGDVNACNPMAPLVWEPAAAG